MYIKKESYNRFCPFLIIVLITLSFFPIQAKERMRPMLLNVDELIVIKRSPSSVSYINYIKDADSFLSKPDIIITEKPLKFCNDPHYYVSLSPYWWPDPSDKDAPYINRDGYVNPERENYDYPKLLKLSAKLKSLSIAYFLTSDRKYKSAYIRQLRKWFVDRRTYMYPNLEYGQIKPNHFNNQGTINAIVEAGAFFDVVESIRLMDYCGGIGCGIRRRVLNWFRSFTTWLYTSEKGVAQRNNTSNIALLQDVCLYNFATLTGQNEICQIIISDFPERRLKKQIMDDGSQPLELKRTRAFHYSIYNMFNVINFCVLAEANGVHFYQQNSDIIDKAYAYLNQFVDNRESFPYSEISDWNQCVRSLKSDLRRIERLKGVN